ncbi:MAG: hypothetical protein NTY74_14020 [Ignavibacteriae bacterium]|nr:hypothetical protein [Ignavibacteriota bacterium]
MGKNDLLQEHKEFMKENRKLERKIVQKLKKREEYDTIVFPAHNDGFNEVFINKNEWYAERFSENSIKKLKYIVCYRTSPVSAITHYAKITQIKFEFNKARYVIKFDVPKRIGPINNNNGMSFQGLRYTKLEYILKAKFLKNCF